MEMETLVNSSPSRVLRMGDAKIKTGLCPSTIHDLIKRDLFPKPFLLVPGGRAVGWFESELDLWLAQRKRESDAKNEGVSA